MAEYMNYGMIGYGTPALTEVNTTRRSQVYQATHGGDDNRLPFMNRSFISFTFDGKHIEDFNLVATIDGDRMSRSAYSPFDDIVTSYDNLDGQQYWSTHYKNNTLDFNLSTDGMNQQQLDSFKNWFQAGVTKELILAEHPNRAALARVSEPPALHLLPFESTVSVNIAGSEYLTKTTLYKGDISLKFVMDSPHWYAKMNVLGEKDEENNAYKDIWEDANGQPVNIFESKDALKILYEDGIPLGSMIQENMLLGDGAFAEAAEQDISLTWSIADDESATGDPEGTGARTEADDATSPYQWGIIAGATVDFTGSGIEELSNESSSIGFFFYSGTAPAPVILKFTLTPHIINGYIDCPYNSYVYGTNKYNTITIGSVNEQKFCFTTPNLLTSYNKAVSIIKSNENGMSKEDLRNAMRDQVRHPRVREWAIKVIDSADDSGGTVSSNQNNTLIARMSCMLKDAQGNLVPMTFIFNSETGEATGELYYRVVNSGTVDNWTEYQSLSINEKKEEDVGDMLRSNYIDKNYPESGSGAIVGWKENAPQNSHYIKHDAIQPLKDISLLYKNMYL